MALTLNFRVGEEVTIGKDIFIRVASVRQRSAECRLQIDAPRHIAIRRGRVDPLDPDCAPPDNPEDERRVPSR